MAFKENLKNELEFKDMKVKELAAQTGISRRTLDQYLATAAKMPSAENAVKIAAVLGVSVEYLVTGQEILSDATEKEIQTQQLRLYRKYHQLISTMENFSDEKLVCVNNLVRDLSKL